MFLNWLRPFTDEWLAAPPQSAGQEEGARVLVETTTAPANRIAAVIDQMVVPQAVVGNNRLNQLGSERPLSLDNDPARATVSLMGAVAGTVDPKGLPYGVALTHVKMPDGQPLSVAFVVDTAEQRSKLMVEMGISPQAIFLIGSSEATQTREMAVSAAHRWLADVYQVEQAVDIGAEYPIALKIEAILKAVFGIKLTPQTIEVWNSFIEWAASVLKAQA